MESERIHELEAVAKTLPRLRGRRLIGSGSSSLVFESGVPGRALKLASDPASILFLGDPQRPTGPHYPIVFSAEEICPAGRLGFPVSLFELERLFPLTPASASWAAAEALCGAYLVALKRWSCFSEEMGRLALGTLARSLPCGLPEDFRPALLSLETFSDDIQAIPDLLLRENLMARADGTLVLSDPLFS